MLSKNSRKNPCGRVQAVIRWLSVLWGVREELFFSFFSVYVVGAAPIAIHLLARFYNAAGIDAVTPDIVADGYLYAFIISLAGMVDSINDSKRSTTMGFFLLAGFAGLSNYTTLLGGIGSHPIIAQASVPFIEVFLPFVGLRYAWYKVFALCRAAAGNGQANVSGAIQAVRVSEK